MSTLYGGEVTMRLDALRRHRLGGKGVGVQNCAAVSFVEWLCRTQGLQGKDRAVHANESSGVFACAAQADTAPHVCLE